MRPTLRQLHYLVAVADTGKFRDAARLLNVSQPSLSAQLADAEAQLGAALVERGRRGASLTPLGEDVVQRARAILTQVEDLKTVVRSRSQGPAGHYRLGTVPTIGPYLLPGAVKRLHALYPELKLSVREERTIDLQKKLDDGRLDMVISTPEDHRDAAYMPLFDETLWICTAVDDPLAAEDSPVHLKDLEGRDVLSLGYGHRLSKIVQGLADLADARVSTEYEGTSLDALRQMAAMGVGIAILPSLYAMVEARRDPALAIRQLIHPQAIRPVSLLWRAASPLARHMQQIGTLLQQAGQELLGH